MKDMERKEQEDLIYKNAEKLRTNKTHDSSGNFPELGLCNKCNNLQSITTEFGARKAHCYHNIVILNGKQRIATCSRFWDKSYQSIGTLLQYDPIFIDPNKEKIGF